MPTKDASTGVRIDKARLARNARFLVFAVAVACAYYLSARLAVVTALPPEGIAIIWPANAIVFAALLSVERRRWPLLALAALAAEILADVPDYPLAAAVGYGLANVMQATIAATLLQLALGERRPVLRTVGGLLRFLLVGPLIAAGLTSACGALVYKLVNAEIDYLAYWRILWMGDGTGLLILGGLFLTLRGRSFALPRRPAWHWLEPVAAWSCLAAALAWASLHPHEVLPFMLFPPLIWIALRWAEVGAALAVALTTAVTVTTAIAGIGLFAEFSVVDRVLDLQVLIAATAVSTLLIAFAQEEARTARAALEQTNARLDATVETRTGELRQALERNRLLLAELTHRVKNNLQLVLAILQRSGRSVRDPEARALLARVETQVLSIASVYETINRAGGSSEVDVLVVLPTLCESARRALDCPVEMQVAPGETAPMAAAQAVPLCLAINELVTNAAKHAGPAPEVVVRCEIRGGDLAVTVRDNGPGLPPGFDFGKTGRFGGQMVVSCVASAGGTVRALPFEGGAAVEIVVPLAG